MMRMFAISGLLLTAFLSFAALADQEDGYSEECRPGSKTFNKDLYDAANDFSNAVNIGNETKMRAAWGVLNKNKKGQTELRKCSHNTIGDALQNNQYALADLLMGPEFNFDINEYDQNRSCGETPIRRAVRDCNAEQILVLRLFGVKDDVAKKEQAFAERLVERYGPSSTGKTDSDSDLCGGGHRSTKSFHYSDIMRTIKHQPPRKKTAADAAYEAKQKAFNQKQQRNCRASQWALTVPLSEITGASGDKNDLTKGGTVLKETDGHKAMLAHEMNDEDHAADDRGNEHCPLAPVMPDCGSPIHRVLEAVQFLQIKQKHVDMPPTVQQPTSSSKVH